MSKKDGNKQLYTPKVLNPLQEEIDEIRAELVAHYSALPKFNGDPGEKADEVIKSSRLGWRNCPKTFAERVRVKAKMRHAGGANIRSWGEINTASAGREGAIAADLNDANPLRRQVPIEVIDHIGRDKILRALKAPDKKFWKQRESHYRHEFDFNASADFSLLIEVIANELKIHKIHEMEFAELEVVPDLDMGVEGPDPQKLLAFSKMASEAHRQLQDSLRSLGVTRDQRKDELDGGEGDIATLSLALDKKLAAKDAIERADKEEEDAGLRRKFLRGDVHDIGLDRAIHNRIPNAEEVSEIIAEAGIMDGDELAN